MKRTNVFSSQYKEHYHEKCKKFLWKTTKCNEWCPGMTWSLGAVCSGQVHRAWWLVCSVWWSTPSFLVVVSAVLGVRLYPAWCLTPACLVLDSSVPGGWLQRAWCLTPACLVVDSTVLGSWHRRAWWSSPPCLMVVSTVPTGQFHHTKWSNTHALPKIRVNLGHQ